MFHAWDKRNEGWGKECFRILFSALYFAKGVKKQPPDRNAPNLDFRVHSE